MKNEYKEPCKEKCLEHKYHCVKCNTAVSYSPANFTSRPNDIPNFCEYCTVKPQEVSKCCGIKPALSISTLKGRRKLCNKCGKPFEPQEVREEVKWCGCNENIENGKCKHTIPVKEEEKKEYCKCQCHPDIRRGVTLAIECKHCTHTKEVVKESDWESRWDKYFDYHEYPMINVKRIKYFIRKELLQQRQDLLKELEEEVGKLIKENIDDRLIDEDVDIGYESALEQVLALIKSKK